MGTSAHIWQKLVEILSMPPYVRKKQYESIKYAIEELQEFALTNARVTDGSPIKVEVKGNELLISGSDDTPGEGETEEQGLFSGTLQVCQIPTWNGTVLAYTPVSIGIVKGRIVSILALASVTIDTTEECT